MIKPRLLKRLEAKKDQLDKLRPFPTASIHRLRDEILIEWIYNSNAIEGSTITLQETRLILETGLTVGGKSLRDISKCPPTEKPSSMLKIWLRIPSRSLHSTFVKSINLS